MNMRELLDDIATAIQRIYREGVDPVGEKFAFEKRPSEGEIGGPPMVLFLGNHSSGKSTFVNHLIGDSVQKTGMAPTDDSFTLLTWGSEEEEKDGQSIVSNPDLPYGGLKHFGQEFISHFRMKRRPVQLLREVTLVDSPGMIDAAREESGRGYDYAGVARWFAERADVVLCFFDPDKPGTTGETLQVFTDSLRGIDHKLLIVMNKMDRFRSLQDFARAYGALCWNLGKVIPRKDLPHVYTTFIPVEGEAPAALPTEDFESAREELITEIKRAPARRVDNMLTQLQSHAERLRVHARILDAAAGDLRSFRGRLWTFLVMLMILGCLVGVAALTLVEKDVWAAIIAFVTTILVGYGGFHVIRWLVRGEEKHLREGLPAIFERLYSRELLVRDRAEDLKALWEIVHPRAKKTIETLGLLGFKRLKSSELDRLAKILDSELPEMRSRLHKGLGVPASTT